MARIPECFFANSHCYRSCKTFPTFSISSACCGLFKNIEDISVVVNVVPCVVGEDYKLYKLGSWYFKSFWNCVVIFQVFCSVLAVIMYMVKSDRLTSAIRKLQDNDMKVSKKLLDGLNKAFQYSTLLYFYLLYFTESENAVLRILTFLVTVKRFQLIRFNSVNQHVAEFSETLKT